jgi:hypothetical protein
MHAGSLDGSMHCLYHDCGRRWGSEQVAAVTSRRWRVEKVAAVCCARLRRLLAIRLGLCQLVWERVAKLIMAGIAIPIPVPVAIGFTANRPCTFGSGLGRRVRIDP